MASGSFKPGRLVKGFRGKTVPRERTALAIWFWEIDRVLLSLIAVLIAIGLVAVAAASPVAAIDRSTSEIAVNPLIYFYRQLMWVGIGLPVMLVISMLPRTQARRLALGMTAFFLLMLLLVPILGNTINGAKRWIDLPGMRFQPSEFLKPAFVVTLAWLLSLRGKDANLPVIPLSGLLTAIVALLLMRQPDLGQTVIFCAVWGALLLLSGVSMRAIGGLVAGAMGLFVLTYIFYENGRNRINDFLGFNVATDTGPDQVDLAHKTITNGGFTGVGPGGGQAKFNLPEAHTDYIFSVIGEEFGLLACIGIAIVYLAIVVRVLLRLLDEEDSFIILAAAGLTTEFGLQAIINMGVNAHIFPSKGMTLPFISYGGSSMIALCIGVGLLLAFTRRNPFMDRSPYVVKWSGR
ncbi:putative lipid II flippase FtsW [soil metagenome]|uniref:FtsW/RodA/SpoVE family cell cycle protein n=1 Tax=unclassified Sphingobium TaxID=2611147 RepID=UPI001E3BD818|nr:MULTISPECIES: putative peptidoglycan glycosyltransferase FtsW [unclassified Sphingobium]GLI97903.1 cell division protein FtsW [Sphingobium sp. BS19]CAH0349539.1 putative peptidoglycan glycosyltransferase FtsW [Sphingobium sp. CECT 9361]